MQRWLDRAGEHARQTIADQLAGVPTSGQFGTDGLWARLRQDTTRVVLLLTEQVGETNIYDFRFLLFDESDNVFGRHVTRVSFI